MFGRNKKKQSFFERLTGAVSIDEFDDDFDFDNNQNQPPLTHNQNQNLDNQQHPNQGTPPHRSIHIETEDDHTNEQSTNNQNNALKEEPAEEQLSVDVVNTNDSIIIHAMLAGVKPNDIDIDISRDMITIKGSKEDLIEEEHNNFYHQELHWGSFSRNILLPEEIDVDAAEAAERHGLLTLKLPKLDKNRKTKVHVKSR